MDVNIYIGFWTLKMKCTQYGLHGKAAFKNARVVPRSGGRGFGFFSVAPAWRHDECNACLGYLERPIFEPLQFTSRKKKCMIDHIT